MDGAQVRNASAGGTAPSTSSTTSSSYSSADADDNAGAGGAKVWVLVLLFSLLVLLFLPSAVRRGGTGGGGGGYQRGGLKRGWDVVNLCLVLFAILGGLLGRRGGGGDGDGESSGAAAAAAASKNPRQVTPTPVPATEAVTKPSSAEVWASFNSSASYANHHAHTGIRRMKSSSSYPELRLDSDGVWGLASPEAAWRFYDDAELYRTRRPERQERSWDVDPPHRTPPEVKTIPVDPYEVRRRSPPQEALRRRVERLPKMAEVEEETTHPTETTVTPARRRSWSAEAVDATPEQKTPVEVAPAAPPPPPPPPPRRRRRSVEKLPRTEELETEILVGEIKNTRPSSPAMFLPGTPPPPPPPPETVSRSKKKRSGSVGGAKDLASAIALFYQKKRKKIGIKSNKKHHHHHLSDDHYSSPSSDASASPVATARTNPPPPPPPPPPSSIFSNLFKKGSSKSRRIHSVAPPQPPPPPPFTRRSRKPPPPPSRPAPPPPPPPPVRTRPPRAQAHPQQQLPLYPRRAVVYYTYPLPPPSPPLPPPPPPPPPMSEGEEEVPSVTASPAPAYCASPDVNAKADKFIERFRAGLKLEKINSYREKWQMQIQEDATVAVAEDEGEFMVIGSLFDDDDDNISLPETPATATAAAVAVGF